MATKKVLDDDDEDNIVEESSTDKNDNTAPISISNDISEETLSETRQEQIRKYAKKWRETHELVDEGLIADLLSIYGNDHKRFRNSEYIKNLIREGCFSKEETALWAETEKYDGIGKVTYASFPGLEIHHIEQLKKKRKKLVLIVNKIHGELYNECYPEISERTKKFSSLKKQDKTPEPKPTTSLTQREDFIKKMEKEEEIEDISAELSAPNSLSSSPETNPKHLYLGGRSSNCGSKLDYFRTPKPVCAFLDVVIDILKKDPSTADLFSGDVTFWECCCGKAKAISNHLESMSQEFFQVLSTDIDPPEGEQTLDFLFDEPEFEYDIIITNPPWSSNKAFISRCFEIKKPFVLLMKLDVLSNAYFVNAFYDHLGSWNFYLVPIKGKHGFKNSEGTDMQVGTIGWYIFIPINDESLSSEKCVKVFYK
jgi:hypothetical protein